MIPLGERTGRLIETALMSTANAFGIFQVEDAARQIVAGAEPDELELIIGMFLTARMGSSAL